MRSEAGRDRLDRFFFRPGSAWNLGFCRALFFLGVLIFHHPQDIKSWATIPHAYWRPIWLFHVLRLKVISEHHLQLLLIVWIVAVSLSCLGLLTRVSTAVSFVLSLYILGLPHNFGKVGHGDPVLIFTMLILAISRCGDGFSIDAMIRRRRAQLSGEYTWPVRMACVLLSIVFCAAGCTKLIRSGSAWITSDNLQILLLQHYYILNSPFTKLGVVLARHALVCHILAAGTIALEISFPLALFSRRLRRILVPGAFLMQVGIGLVMGVYFTQFMIAYLFWVPWRRLTRRIRRHRLMRGFPYFHRLFFATIRGL